MSTIIEHRIWCDGGMVFFLTKKRELLLFDPQSFKRYAIPHLNSIPSASDPEISKKWGYYGIFVHEWDGVPIDRSHRWYLEAEIHLCRLIDSGEIKLPTENEYTGSSVSAKKINDFLYAISENHNEAPRFMALTPQFDGNPVFFVFSRKGLLKRKMGLVSMQELENGLSFSAKEVIRICGNHIHASFFLKLQSASTGYAELHVSPHFGVGIFEVSEEYALA